MRGRSSVGPVLIAAVLALLLACASPVAAEGPPDPTITVAPSPVSLTLKLGSLLDTGDTSDEATGTVLVTRLDTTETAVSMTAFLAGSSRATTATPDWIALETTDTAQVVAIGWRTTQPNKGWLSFSDSKGQPVVVPFEVHATTPAAVLGQVCGYSAAIAALIMLVSVLWLVFTTDKAPAGTDAGATKLTVSEGPTWTFQGSWATNLTALGALFGTVLSTSGFLSEVMPGLSLGVFVGFNLLYLLLLPLAGVVYQAFSLTSKPSFPGLVAAGGITLWATLGELATALVLFMRGGMSPWLVGLIIPVAGVVLTLYAVASLRAATHVASEWIDPESGATSAAATVAAHRVLHMAGEGDGGDGWTGPNKDSQETRRRAELAAAIVVAAAGADDGLIKQLVEVASPPKTETPTQTEAADGATMTDVTAAAGAAMAAPRPLARRVRTSRAPILF
jgi:hypothetical protein